LRPQITQISQIKQDKKRRRKTGRKIQTEKTGKGRQRQEEKGDETAANGRAALKRLKRQPALPEKEVGGPFAPFR
jgi:hypothetical protein